MTERKRRQQDDDKHRDVPTNAQHVGDFDTEPADDDMWSEEELERANMGWRAEDEQDAQNVPTNAPPVDDLEADIEDLDDTLAEADDALRDMAAREMRRDQYHSSGGDDHNPGFDSDINTNAPKEDDLGGKKRAGSRGKSDWH